MASIRQRPDGVWRARYRDDTGKEHARHFKLKRDAQRWLDEVTTSVVTGMYVDPPRRLSTLVHMDGRLDRTAGVGRRQRRDRPDSRAERFVAE